MDQGILEKTGQPVSHWIEQLRHSGLEKHKAMVDWLKDTHGFTHGYANYVAHQARAAAQGAPDEDEMLKAQYANKPAMWPLYEALMQRIGEVTGAHSVAVKKGAVSLIKKRQFALIKAATKTRIDLGLKLPGVAPQGALLDSGPFGSMCTHRMCIQSVADINAALLEWVVKAYDMAAES